MVKVKIGIAKILTTGIDFRTYAKRYYYAAERLRGQPSTEWFDPVPYHLLCQSLELHLKSFIWLTDKLNHDQFKGKYGHDIIKLWRHAKDRGISRYCATTQLRDDTIQLVGPRYKDREFAYFSLIKSRPWIQQLRKNRQVLPTLSRLCKQLNKSLKRPIQQASTKPGKGVATLKITPASEQIKGTAPGRLQPRIQSRQSPRKLTDSGDRPKDCL